MRPYWLVLGFLAASAQATDIYRWTDADGVVHYTDQATPGAQKIRIEAASTYKGAATVPRAASAKGKPPQSPAGKYELVEITSPTQQEVLWNIAGQVSVAVRVQPDLRAGDSVHLFLDNTAVEGSAPDATQFQLKDVFRGVHTLRADVVNDSGKIITSSSPVTFAVRQTSVIKPAG